MGDVIRCKVVLVRGGYEAPGGKCDALAFVLPRPSGRNDWHWIACHEKGKATAITHPEWECEVRGKRLHLTPSLLDTITGFHTAFNWDVEFVVKPEGVGAHEYFFAINPEVTP